jgi:hypothetical protein
LVPIDTKQINLFVNKSVCEFEYFYSVYSGKSHVSGLPKKFLKLFVSQAESRKGRNTVISLEQFIVT